MLVTNLSTFLYGECRQNSSLQLAQHFGRYSARVQCLGKNCSHAFLSAQLLSSTRSAPHSHVVPGNSLVFVSELKLEAGLGLS
jgi:hypothetical protein